MNEADASTFVVKGLKPPRLMPVIAGKTDSSRARSRAKYPSPSVVAFERWTDEAVPAWAKKVRPPPGKRPRSAGALPDKVARKWGEASVEAARPR